MNSHPINIGIIGCGAMGTKRAKALAGARLIAAADNQIACANNFKKNFPQCDVYEDWRTLLKNPDISIIVVATPHAFLAEITREVLLAKKHVFVEKPAGCSTAEIDSLIMLSEQQQVLVRVGFNHRYHRAFRQARLLVNENALGDIFMVRGRYGHGGRLGYEKEWRANSHASGGGELLDQGVHLIDLARWFLGDFIHTEGFAHTYFWNMPVEDNGFMLLKTADKKTAFLHASCTEWKNIFSFEIYGQKGKLDINGLGGSYGVEKLTFYKMLPQMGPPETFSWEYPMADDSFEKEFAEFLEDICLDRKPTASLADARAALKVVEHIYQLSGLQS